MARFTVDCDHVMISIAIHRKGACFAPPIDSHRDLKGDMILFRCVAEPEFPAGSRAVHDIYTPRGDNREGSPGDIGHPDFGFRVDGKLIDGSVENRVVRADLATG